MSKIQETHEELQRMEHFSKVLKEHREITRTLTTEVYVELSDYIGKLQQFARDLRDVQILLGDTVRNIYASVQDMKRLGGMTQDLIAFGAAVKKLDDTLTDSTVKKVLKVIREQE